MVQLLSLTKHKKLNGIGQKAGSLQWLMQQGLSVPQTFVLTYDSHQEFLRDRTQFRRRLERELKARLDMNLTYAVRSSADIEDNLAHSFAGQLASVLSVRGLNGIIQAVFDVYASVQAPRLAPYLTRMGLSDADIQMAVIIQEMVLPEVSGIVFSKNPITGLDEMIVEAVLGDGESLMQDGVTPDRWVYKWGDWKERPNASPIGDDLITQVIEQAKSIVDASDKAVDLEWIYDGQTAYWLQLRPITTLDDLHVYSNRIAREVLPGTIKPLVWSINVPLVNGAWIDLFTELIGPNNLTPQELSVAFHYRAYFNMKSIGQIMVALGMPEETLELMMGLEGGSDKPSFRPNKGIIRHIPRMVRFAVSKYRYEKALEFVIPALKTAYKEFESRPIPKDDEKGILARVAELFNITQDAAYANIVTPVLLYSYGFLLKQRLAKRGIDFTALDLTNGLLGMQDYDPSFHLARLNRHFLELSLHRQQQIRASSYSDFQSIVGIESFQEGVEKYIDHFGHLSDSGNDFSRKPWRETPDLLLKMITEYSAREAGNDALLRWDDLSLTRVGRWELNWLYGRARQFRFYREAVSFLYTYGYGLFRECFMILGESYAGRGLIDEPTDIFYLYYEEVESLAQEGDSAASQQDIVRSRKQEMESSRDALLPDIIYGNQAPPLEVASMSSERLSGIATSPGYYQGPVRVIWSLSEFEQLQQGDVLVIPFSDVSWTPLFSKAGAVVAESGGILSHSSIVAREHNLPAVVSVTGACQLLTNGTIVLIDGFNGEVILSEGGGQNSYG
ncbi:MAG: PEP/pyruvate-binding domain-containing protein [Candidatus Promineifilaceae bacterium]